MDIAHKQMVIALFLALLMIPETCTSTDKGICIKNGIKGTLEILKNLTMLSKTAV